MTCPICHTPLTVFYRLSTEECVCQCDNQSCATFNFVWWNPATKKQQTGIEGTGDCTKEAIEHFGGLCLKVEAKMRKVA